MASKRLKYIEVNLTKEVQDLYTESYEALLKIRENLKNIHIHGFKDLIVKISIIPKLTDRFNIIPIKIPTTFLAEMNRLILKFIWHCKEPQIAKLILKQEQSERIHTC